MSETVDVNKGDVLPPIKNKRAKKKNTKQTVNFIIECLIILVFAIVFSIASQITYDFNRYQKFYVNGESMYPTLNKDAKVFDTVNNKYEDVKTYLIGNFSSSGHKYLCDYGLMDNSEGFIKDVKRFSIIVTYFNEDMTLTNGNYVSKENAELKIKRVLALPREEIYFDQFGDLFIKQEGEPSFSKIEQPFLNVSSWNEESKDFLSKAKSQTNNKSIYAYDASHPYILKDDEYFLVGDNRMEGCSHDSREVGAINSYSFVGRVVTIIGKCWYWISENGNQTESIDWSSIIMPWRLEML